jgi:hypothetical protein
MSAPTPPDPTSQGPQFSPRMSSLSCFILKPFISGHNTFQTKYEGKSESENIQNTVERSTTTITYNTKNTTITITSTSPPPTTTATYI